MVTAEDLNECWCCGGLHDSFGGICPSCDEARCNRFTDECKSDHIPVTVGDVRGSDGRDSA